jgi:hypothetical protein
MNIKKNNLVSYSTTYEESQSFCHSERSKGSPYFKTGNPSALQFKNKKRKLRVMCKRF